MGRADLRWAWAATAAALLLWPPSGLAARERLAGPVEARIVRIVDGDTLEVRARVWLGHEVATLVRLVGVNTPEIKGRCAAERVRAEQAAHFLSDLFARDPAAVLTDIRHDKYGGRILARVHTTAGRDVGELMIAAGLAVAYDGGARASWCAAPGRPKTP